MSMIIHKELLEINPYIRICAHTKTHPGWCSLNRIIYDHQIVLVLSGHGEVIIEGRRYECSKGDMFIIRPGVTHSMITRDEAPYDMLVVHFDYFYERERNFWPHKKIYVNKDMTEIPEQYLIRGVPVFENSMSFPEYLKIINYTSVEVLLKKLLDIQEETQKGRELISKAYLLEILHIIYTQIASERSIHILDSGFVRIKKAFEYINNNSEKMIRISELAAMCNLSTNYFANLFKKETGYSPNEYIIRTRIEKAKELLARNTCSISEISEMVGFNDIHYFSVCFKKIEGLSPSAYRQTVSG